MASSISPIESSSIVGWARDLALIRREIPDNALRVRLNEIWTSIRSAMQQQNSEILEIRRIAELGSFTLPSRPITTESVEEMRGALGRALEEAAAEVGATSALMSKLSGLDPSWVRALVERLYRNPPRVTELGCWITHLVPSHPNGYVKANLRNTWYEGAKLDIQPFLHQLIMVGKGVGDQLVLTTGGEYEISHLCHNGGCFNPDHLIIEPSALNRARAACKGSRVVRIEGLVEVCLCTHWDDSIWYGGVGRGQRRKCILPVLRLGDEHRYKYVLIDRQGQPLVRG